MDSGVLLDAAVVTRCRRRVHLDHDPTMRDATQLAPNPAIEQRVADTEVHREEIAQQLREANPGHWVTVPEQGSFQERVEATRAALEQGADYVWQGLLPVDRRSGRRGGVELLVRTAQGYVPVLVVRHRITDPGRGARTASMTEIDPEQAEPDRRRKVRSHPRDVLRLAHAYRMLEFAGKAEPHRALGGVIGLDADVIVWHDLEAETWPGGRHALAEYDERFTDRIAVAQAASQRQEALAEPSRVLECQRCPWWLVCEQELTQLRDVSLVVRGDDATELRKAGISTVDKLAALNRADDPPIRWTGVAFADAVLLARAWLADLSVVRRVEEVRVPRADVEVDIDMESFGDSGSYLWGCLLSGVDIGIEHGYWSFATWDPLPTPDEARSFAEFWAWLSDVRSRTAAAGLSFRAYCYNALAENRWMFSSVERFGGMPGIPPRSEVEDFVYSTEWVDLFRSVSDQFLCAQGKGLKMVAPAAGFQWRDPEAGGEASMGWYRVAVGMDGDAPVPAQRDRLLRYNEDDVWATRILRDWMSGSAQLVTPHVDEL